MWAQAFSLVTPRIQQELGVADKDYGDIFSVFSAGLTVGAFMWGILVDIIGRRWAFNLTVGIVATFGKSSFSDFSSICLCLWMSCLSREFILTPPVDRHDLGCT